MNIYIYLLPELRKKIIQFRVWLKSFKPRQIDESPEPDLNQQLEFIRGARHLVNTKAEVVIDWRNAKMLKAIENSLTK